MEQWTDILLNWVGAFTPQIALIVFFLSFIGEAFVISIPLVFETIFVLAGINLTAGILPFYDVVFLALTSQLGRQGGALVLYFLSRRSTTFFWKLIARRFPERNPVDSTVFKFLRHLDSISPFGVALGRLLWLRIPLTLILGARRKLKTLILGIAISSTVYEAVYIGLGAIVGKTVKLDSPLIWLSIASSLGIMYLIAFLVRISVNRMKNRRKKDRESGVTPISSGSKKEGQNQDNKMS